MTFIGVLIGLVIALLLSALVIFIVGKLGLGLEVDSFGSAVIAALVIAVVTWAIMLVLGFLPLSIGVGILGAIVSLIVSAIVLMISDKIVSGMRVNGFVGALIAAVLIGIGHWLLGLLLGGVLNLFS